MKKNKKQSGQAMLAVVGLLSVGLLMATTNILIGIIGHDQALAFQQSDQGRCLAEAGAEEASLRLARNPDYSGGQLVIDEKNVNIEVSGDNAKTVVSSVNYFGKIKKVQVTVNISSGLAEITDWQEVK